MKTNEKQETHYIDDSNVERLTSLYKSLSTSLEPQKEITILLKSLAAGNTEAYPRIKALLLADNGELENLLQSAFNQKQDSEGSEVYSNLKFTLMALDPSFEKRIDEFEASRSHSPASLETAHISSLSGRNPEIEGDVIKSMADGGEIISIDTSKKPPERSLSLKGTEYSLSANRSL